MERSSKPFESSSIHAGYEETPRLEHIRSQLEVGDHLFVRTESGSVYSFLLLRIVDSLGGKSFGAKAILVDAPDKTLTGKLGTQARIGEECLFLIKDSTSPLKIIPESFKREKGTATNTVPTIITSPIVGFGVRKQN